MLSLHYITHAVCFVIISALLKKHIELRYSHYNLKFEHKQLRTACITDRADSSAHLDLCLCPCQSQGQFSQTTDFENQFRTFAEHGVESSSASAQKMFASVSDPQGGVPVDEFGRSAANPAQNDYAAVEIHGSVSTTYFSDQSQSAAYSALSQQPSATYSSTQTQLVAVTESAIPRQHLEGSTHSNQETPVSFQKTSEFLETVKPLPSSYTHIQSSTAGSLRDVDGENHDDDNNDFYQGSHFREGGGGEEVDVIVTSVTGRMHGEFYPQGVQESFDEYYGENYGEWEDVEEEEVPHPAFGNVTLQWLTEEEVDGISQRGSSVHCKGLHLSDRMCHFRNLCFKPQSRQFVFLLGPRSVQENIPDEKSQEALLELSTVAGHNAQYFSYLTVPATDIKDFQVASIPGTTVVFKRFKPDNIMHAFHDDIIPLFQTLTSLGMKPGPGDKVKFPVALFFADENDEGEYYNLYEIFAANSVFTANSLIASVAKTTSSDSMVCFVDAHVGLAKTTTWYQYGFFEPQGPIPNALVQSDHVHNVAAHLLSNFANSCALCGDGNHLVLVSRKETRRILNEMELVMALSREFKVKVMTVSLEMHELADILPIIHSSLGIIGMHGSLLSLAAFLRQGSILVELFPYAVNPHHYTPYATLCRLPGMLIAYRAWTNHDATMSVPHPDWSKDFGGLHHLPLQQKQEIVSQTEVPNHLCCKDPSWLYHIFQDTYIHIPQVLSLVASALHEATPLRMITTMLPSPGIMIPAPAQNLQCVPESGNSLRLEWTAPWNADISVDSDVSYSVVLQNVVSGRTMSVDAGRTSRIKVMEGVQKDQDYRVWVKSYFGSVVGRFAAMRLCSTKS